MSKTRFFRALSARALACALALSTLTPTSLSQDAKRAGEETAAPPTASAEKAAPKATDERAEQILARAVEAMGGRAFLDVRTVTSRGYFTPFQEGVATLPSSFTDYMVFPDRERTEFRSQGVRTIQTYTGETGWIFEGMGRKLTDVSPAQAKDFRLALRTSIDNILRGWWRAEGAELKYVGRREAGLARRNEVVRLTYADGFVVEFEFGAKDFLPAKTLYKKQNPEGDEVAEEDRYAQYLMVGGVRIPFVIDHFRAGQQTSRVNYEAVDFNRPVPETLFARPADIKALK
jgi:hypothetical protein